MTHPGILNQFCKLHEVLLVLRSVFATHKDLDWDSPALDLVKIFCCSIVVSIDIIKP